MPYHLVKEAALRYHDKEIGAALGKEGKRDSRRRQEPRHDGYVDHDLEHDHGGYSQCQIGVERIPDPFPLTCPDAEEGKKPEEDQHDDDADKSALLGKGGEDEVILNVIEDPEKYSAVVDFYAELD